MRGCVWGRGRLRVLFVRLVSYSTVLDFRRWRLFLKFLKPRQNDMVELWKCSLKIEGWGFEVVRKLIFRAECNSKNIGLSYCLLYFAQSSFKFLFLCVFKWYSLNFPYIHIIAEILLIFFQSALFLIIFFSKIDNS